MIAAPPHWTGYGSGDVTLSDDGGSQSSPGMTIELQRYFMVQFGFSDADIPRNARITGITLRTEGHGDGATAGTRSQRAQLCLGTDPALDSLYGARVGIRTAWNWTTSDTIVVRPYSQDTDPLWNFPWTAEAIKDPSFGVVFSSDSATPAAVGEDRYIDHVTLEIIYTDPATGYAWHPVIRCVPDNGAEETIDLRTVLTDLHGPMKTDAKYAAIQERRETINRRIVPAPFGFRAEIILTLDILTMADAAHWTKIVNRCMSTNWAVYLSMDGGITERQVFLSRMDGPDPLGGKTHVGGRFLLGLTTVEAFAEMPEFGGIGFGLGNW